MIFSKKAYLVYIVILTILIIFSYFTLDIPIAKFFLADTKTYEPIGDFISIFGESHWYIGSAIIGFVVFKYFKKNNLYANRFLFLLYINIFSGLISLFLKYIFGRMRPWGMRHGGDEFGFLLIHNFEMSVIERMKYHATTLGDAPTTFTSFPSGHTTTVFAFFTFLSIFFPRYIYLWLFGAVILASSRLLANDHFLSDIFAGIMVGTISTLFIYSKMRNKLEQK
ncbi:MAG: phosphatase PAP2 family protein [Sulfurimonas sp.]|nr:phosphatase PAP2 family protein [Sulfurimonas sp.]